jgi:signal transduction histidine kinase
MTEAARRAKARREEERAALRPFAARLSHELNNPLAAVKANLHFVEEAIAFSTIDPELLRALRESRDALERIARVAAEFRSLALCPERAPVAPRGEAAPPPPRRSR